jgi:hypothetical protein
VSEIGYSHSRSEDGSGYGLDRATYRHVAHTVMEEGRIAEIEPVAIAQLPTGEAGCELLLCGKGPFGYLLEVRPETFSLWLVDMDGRPERFEILVGDTADDSWRHLKTALLRLGGWAPGFETWEKVRQALAQPVELGDLVCCL